MQQQKSSAIKSCPSASTYSHVAPSHPLDSRVPPPLLSSPHSPLDPLNGEERDITMILALSTSMHKHIHESDHLDSDKEATTVVNPSKMELPQGNATIISTRSILDFITGWIDVHKKKGIKNLQKIP